MHKITIYVSEDGKIFNDEFDCLEYEISYKINKSTISMYDKSNNPLRDFTSHETWNKVETVKIISDYDVEVIKEIYEFTGFYDNINKKGTWRWRGGQQDEWEWNLR